MALRRIRPFLFAPLRRCMRSIYRTENALTASAHIMRALADMTQLSGEGIWTPSYKK